MAAIDADLDDTQPRGPTDRMERQLRDYVRNTAELIWQRQGIFLAATLLSGFYFDWATAIALYGAVMLTEVMDLYLSRRIHAWNDGDPRKARAFLVWILVNTVLSAVAICAFVFAIALQQDGGGHFTPLFFLFAAGVFAAMNNHQLLPALILRLAIYFVTFFLIVLLDIWRYNPPLKSDAWLQFFTVLFVVYFIADCSFAFLRMYRQQLQQLEDLQAEHERTKAAYEVKSKFISTVSHELRTPLTSIKGSLDLLNSGALGDAPDTMRPMIEIAGRNSKRLADLINDLLDLQKIEAGEMVYRFESLSVRNLIADAVEANLGYADSLGITLVPTLPEEDVIIQGDEARLMQVMGNVISNALKFSDKGSSVRVYYERVADRVRICVKDSGIGIPAGAKDKVFGKFTQVDGSDQRRVGGTGLGMNITKQIVERHKGEIDYVSREGKGTTFFIEFDVHEVRAAA
ncbi:MAG: HAMP domain-containing histidine kinase [Rhodobacteraceae bacterium]|nr:MAG: HAMP domain-containing histidine kinase [Paracoccaceae bacterium]